MKRQIVMKVDASVSSTKGTALGYEAVVYDEQGRYERLTNSRYIPDYIKTTDAETIAVAFGVMEMFEAMEDKREEYRLVVESDCEPTVEDIEDQFNDESNVERVLNYFADNFDSFHVRWIPRSDNGRADAIARSALQRGWEEA